ncbi:MAG: single-stranded-DNA-specific exonuclease RecJ [Candidatus Omnitrophota bacterium]|nr:single-stranded-DNA-specific exonuclease RecJ [Candidatus Omnitrophota bacterium]
MKRKLWKIKELTPQAQELGKRYNISTYLAQILLNRGIEEASFKSFLNHDLSSLYSSYLLPDIERAVKRIKLAVSRKERILVVGDYDVDGITSLAIFYEFIKEFSDTFSFYIPHRVKEGYGLNTEAIEKAKKENRSLIIAFDCGTNSFEEINLAKNYGIDIVVIDHHHPKDNLNNPFAFINPKRKDSAYPFSDLSSAALSFKLLQALKEDMCFEVLDLVALSLVCDVVPLKGENRVLLKEGLRQLRKTTRPAIKALCKISKIKQENIDNFHIGYILGPRINASGRVASAKDALEIFLTEDKEKILDIASKLHEYNQMRKGIETDILKEAEERLSFNVVNDYAIVVSGDGWHSGVLGIVAARLVDKYYRPSFVISFDQNLGKGSGRSIHSVHLMEVLDKCAGPLCSYGGHRKAAGIEIAREDLDGFKERLNTYIKENIKSTDLVPVLDIDLKMSFEDISVEFIGELESLEPFGEENPRVLFASLGILKKSPPKKISNGYSVWLTDNKKTFEGIIYDRDILDVIEFGDSLDIVYSLEKNNYHNIPKLVIRDARLAGNKS